MKENKEEWRPVCGYEGLYEVSSLGRVRSVDRHIISADGREYDRKGVLMKLRIDKGGYVKVGLRHTTQQKQYSVHRLVAQAFIPNPGNLPQINHKDENPTNNRVDNLEWCTAEYNINYGLHNEKVRNFKLEWWKDDNRRKIMSESKIGPKNPNFGKKYTDEEKEARSRKLSKRVYQYTLDWDLVAEYKSVREAASINGYDRGTLSKACRGIIRYGYRWSYERV